MLGRGVTVRRFGAGEEPFYVDCPRPRGMDRAEFAARIDHTVLGPETTPDDVEAVLGAAAEHGTNACIPPCYVAEAVEAAPEVTVVTVCGFPHGQAAPGTKEDEAERAWRDGADEIDVVLNVGRLRAGENDAVREELERVVAARPARPRSPSFRGPPGRVGTHRR